MSKAIETRALGKRYAEIIAVDELSLSVSEGEIYAFLGLNGAGKTTTIRMLLGMVKPTIGCAMVLGNRIQPGRRAVWADVGYLVETSHAYPELTVVENLEIARRLHPGTERAAIHRTIERLGLAAYAGRPAGVLSLGNLQRLGLAKALLHNPKLLILDEPANGLDPVGIVEIRELLLSLAREEGVTVFMSSHILGEVSRLAQRIGILHRGRLLQELSIDELRANRRKCLLVRTCDIKQAHAALVRAGYAPALGPEGMLVLNEAEAIRAPDRVATLLVDAATPPLHLSVEEEDLEHYFLRLIGEKAANEEPALGANGRVDY